MYTAVSCAIPARYVHLSTSSIRRPVPRDPTQYRGFRANYTLSSHCGPISTRNVDRSIPTVDIEFGSARYSGWRALRAASHQQLPVPAGLYRTDTGA